ICSIAPVTMQVLQAYAWPGNVRELQRVLQEAVFHASGDVLTPACLPESIRIPSAHPPRAAAEIENLDVGHLVGSLLRAGEAEIYRKVCRAVDRVILNVVLRHVQGNQVQASELLGITRATLRAKRRSMDKRGEE